MKLTEATVDINIYDGSVYGTGRGGTVFVAYPIRPAADGKHVFTDTLNEPLLTVVLPGAAEEEDFWIQNNEERPQFKDKRYGQVLDFMFGMLT